MIHCFNMRKFSSTEFSEKKLESANLKSDNIENSRIEMKGIVLPVPSNQIKVTFIIILPFKLVHL